MNELPAAPSPLSELETRPAIAEGGDQRGTFRALAEAFVSLFIAVLLFRTFAAEGYMISTGSMAPCLLGFHKRLVCPTCHATFSFGTAYDTDEDPEASANAPSRSRAVCPNCGQTGIDVAEVPRNHGDQLLVNKQAYLYRIPERWEVIVFRNPARPTEAYVKRTIGRPGERIQIVDGDVIVNGEIARKNYEQQRAVRILVNDHDFRPVDDDDFQPHWQPRPSAQELRGAQSAAWQPRKGSFVLKSPDMPESDSDSYAWVEYQHWIRTGGTHETTVPLREWPRDLESAAVPRAGLKYEPRKQEFSVTGALPRQIARRLLDLSSDVEFREAVRELYTASHVIPVPDDYGYNPPEDVGPPHSVRDLMVSMNIAFPSGRGEFVIEMTNGSTAFRAVFDRGQRTVQLFCQPVSNGSGRDPLELDRAVKPVDSAAWPDKFEDGGLVEMSLMDKQVIIALNGRPVIEPWPFEFPVSAPAARNPVRFGARGLTARVSQLRLYRDVYYTDTRSRHAVNRPYQLGPEEFFVLGDNSPVSHDSRRWDNPGVDRSLLIGKPFLVHLPSKPGVLKLGQRELHLRIPDWERIRLLK